MNDGLTIWIVFGGIILAAAAFIYVVGFIFRRQNRNAAIAAIKQGHGVFLTWNYSPDDWKLAAEEHFQIKPRRLGENGKASFTERYVYITNGKDELLYELIGPDKYIKYLTEVYLAKLSAQDVIKFEVRTKTIKKDEYGNNTMEEEYDVENFYVPVPKDAPAEGAKVLNFYKQMLDKNADAVAAVMPYGLGIFRK